jgi:hypothetical protein
MALCQSRTRICYTWHRVDYPVAFVAPISDVSHAHYHSWNKYVDENHDESIKILHEHLIHQIHKIGWCIS